MSPLRRVPQLLTIGSENTAIPDFGERAAQAAGCGRDVVQDGSEIYDGAYVLISDHSPPLTRPQARKFDVQRALTLYNAHEVTRFREGLVDIDPKSAVLQTELQTAKFTVLVRDSSHSLSFLLMHLFRDAAHTRRKRRCDCYVHRVQAFATECATRHHVTGNGLPGEWTMPLHETLTIRLCCFW